MIVNGKEAKDEKGFSAKAIDIGLIMAIAKVVIPILIEAGKFIIPIIIDAIKKRKDPESNKYNFIN